MAAKLKSHALPLQHTSGIFSDMAVDGPLIGTLVLVVDRAKNLPNRKTIGKQDPYCAARLGKEAKKTNTDIRGGQTPRWYARPRSLSLRSDFTNRDICTGTKSSGLTCTTRQTTTS